MVLERMPLQGKKIPALVYWAFAALVMFLLEITNKASFEYSFLASTFTFATGCTIQILGGLTNLFGLCTFVFAAQHVLVSQVVKAMLGQPPEQRLSVPLVTMGVYCVGVTALGFGAYIGRYFKFNKGRALFVPIVDPAGLRNLAIAAIVFGLFRTIVVTIFGYDQASQGLATGGVFGILRQLQFIDSVAVAAGTGAIIIASQGRRSIGVLNLIPLVVAVLVGFISAGRATIAYAILAYGVACLAFGFRFRVQHYLGMAFAFYVLQFILSPYSLAARYQVRTSDFGKNLEKAIYLLGDVIANPGKYNEGSTVAEAQIPPEFKLMRYYPRPNNTLERYAVMKSADGVIAATVYRGTLGMRTIIPGFEMLPPSFISDDKPTISTANLLAHRTKGLVTTDDLVTAITLGWVCDSFSAYKWWGIALIPFLMGFFYVVMYGWVIQTDMRRNVLAIGLIPTFVVALSEGTIQVQIITVFQTSIAIFVGISMLYFIARLTDATHVRLKRRRPTGAEQPA